MKKRSLFIILFVLIVAIAACLPYGMGLYTRHQVLHFLEEAEWPQGVQVTLERYDLRYTRSWAVVAVQMAHPASAGLINEPRRAYRGYLRMKMYHGPFFPTEDGIGAGISNIKIYARASDLVPNQVGLQDSLENFFEANEILEANTRIGFTGQLHTALRVSPAFYTAAEEGLFQWGGLTGTWDISSDLKDMNLEIDIEPMLLQAQEEALLDVAEMKFTWKGHHDPQGPWVGKQTLVAPALFLRDEAGNAIRVQHLDLQSNSAVKGDDVEMSLVAEAESFEFLEEVFQRAVFEARMRHLDLQAFMTISERLTLRDQSRLYREDAAEMTAAVIRLLTSGAVFEAQYAMDIGSGGRVNMRADWIFPDLQKAAEANPATASVTPGQWVSQVQAALAIDAPFTWVKQMFYRSALLQLPKDIEDYTDPNTGNKMSIQEALRLDIEDQFNAFINAGIITLTPPDMHFKLEYVKGELRLNGRALNQQDLEKIILFLGGTAQP